MTLSAEDRARIVEAMARAAYKAKFPSISAADLNEHFKWYWRNFPDPQSSVHWSNVAIALEGATAALDAALSAGLAEAIRGQALEDAAEVATLYGKHWNENASKEKINSVGQSVCESAGAAGHEIAAAILALRKETNG